MEVGHELGGGGGVADDVVGEEVWLDGGDAVTLHALDVFESLDEPEERLALMSPEVAYVDAGEDNLLGAIGCGTLGELDGLGYCRATAEATRHGDGAVGAEIVAPVLDFQEGAGAVATGVAACEGAVVEDIGRDDAFLVALEQTGLDILDNLVFLVATEDECDARDFGDAGGLELGVAARHDDEGMRVVAQAAADHLSAFLVGLLGDGTGIDDVDVGLLVEIDTEETGLRHASAHFACLAEVEFAAEGVECDSSGGECVGISHGGGGKEGVECCF